MSDLNEKRALGNTGLEVGVLGMGTAPLGGLFAPVEENDARHVLQAAWDAGIRYYDTAPMYGLGRSEHLLGDLLRGRTGQVLSTKVGRLMVAERAGLDLPPAPPKNPLDPGWQGGLPFREVFDYSYDGVMRSFDDSRQRLGLGNIDLLYVHDIGPGTHADLHEIHWTALTEGGGFRALSELKANGDIKGYGLGVNETQPILDALEETDLDVCLLAGRFTLIDRAAEDTFMKTMLSRGVGIVAGGVFNSGILAAPEGLDATFNYSAAPPDVIDRVARVRTVCRDHGIDLAAAAIQFPLRNPAVSCVALGPRSLAELAQNFDWFRVDIPQALWTDVDEVLAKERGGTC